MNKVVSNELMEVKRYFQKQLSVLLGVRECQLYFESCCASFLKLAKADLILAKDMRLSESEVLQFFDAIKAFEGHVPLAQVIGQQYFYGLELQVDSSVLIPRPETEELVDLIVKECSNAKRVLDIGTGSGCIALAIKSVMKTADVTGIDISKSALTVAQQNAKTLQLEVPFLHYDALILNESQAGELLNEKWDVIVSNPPYIPMAEKQGMDANVVMHEPGIALFVPDNDPLLFYRTIAQWAINALRANGKLYFEIHENYGKEMVRLLEQIGFAFVRLLKDLQGKNRIISAEIIR